MSTVLFGLLIITLGTAPWRREGALPATASAAGATRAVFGQAGALPLSFEPNDGQAGAGVRYVAHGSGFVISLRENDAVVEILSGGGSDGAPAATMRLRLVPVGGKRRPRLVGLGRLPGRSSYFLGADSRRWLRDIPSYGKVEYRQVYPGIDLVFHGSLPQGLETPQTPRLEYDWLLAPRADPASIVERLQGARSLTVDRRGELIISLGHLELRQGPPAAFQADGGREGPIRCRYILTGRDEVGLRVGRYDHQRPLVIDPTLLYSIYLGGSGWDYANAVAVDRAGSAYVTGATGSQDFPLVRPVQGRNGGGDSGADAFVAKLNPAGTALLYSTYLGGSQDEEGTGIALDARGDAFVVGFTESANFPRAGRLKLRGGGRCNRGRQKQGEAFVSELNPAGDRLLWSSCLGGSGTNWSGGVAVGGAGTVYVAGSTTSRDFPTSHPLQGTNRGGTDAFVTKIDVRRGTLVYSTYLGGRGDDSGRAIAVDGTGAAYVTGSTTSPDLPVRRAFQAGYGGGTDTGDAFVARIAPNGRSLLYCSYLGGSGDDGASGIAVDVAGAAYVAGTTLSPNFPRRPLTPAPSPSGGEGSLPYMSQLVSPPSPLEGVLDKEGDGGASAVPVSQAHKAGSSVFVAKVGPAGGLIYSTVLGGSGNDTGSGIAVDTQGDAVATGSTSSTDFPAAAAPQPSYGGGFSDGFVARLDSGGRLAYSTYLGGEGVDIATGIALDAHGNAYVVGGTSSVRFPVTPGRFASRPPFGDAFVAKIGKVAGPLTPQPPSPRMGEEGSERRSRAGTSLTRPRM